MKTLKKTVSVFLIFSLLSPIFSISPAAGSAPEIRISDVTAATGDRVDVEVQFLNNPGINTFSLSVVYDSTYLTLDSVTLNPEVGGQFFFIKRAVWLSGSDVTSDGTFLTLHFTVSADTPEGDIPVTVAYNSGDIGNHNEETVDFSVTPGKITVKNTVAKQGDVNGDGKVNVFDSLLFVKIVVGKSERVPAADVYSDGKINIFDALELRRLIVGKS